MNLFYLNFQIRLEKQANHTSYVCRLTKDTDDLL